MIIYNNLKEYIPPYIRKIIFYLFLYIEKLIFYIEAIFITPFLLIKNNSFLRNKIIFPFTHHSFGHSISATDCICRLFYPEKISIIIILQPNTNKYLFKCFDKCYDIFYFEYFIKSKYFVNPALIRNIILKFYLNLILICKEDFEIINNFQKYYGVMSKTPIPCISGDEINDKSIPYINISGYGRLLENNIGLNPRLPIEDIDYCIKTINSNFPNFFNKPFVTLLLRSKGINSTDITTSFRNTNQENYIKSVEYITSIGYNVVATGETKSTLFNHIGGFYDFSNLIISKNLLNVFLITECASYIGQQSGPYLLANSSGKNCLLIDSWPYRLGSFLKGDINLYKNIYIDGKGFINIKNLFLYHQDLCLGYGYKRKNAKVIDNSEDEISQSCTEFFSKNKFDEESNLKKLIDIIPEYVPFKYAPSRPPSFILRQI